MVFNSEKLYRILNPKSTKQPHKVWTSRKRAKRLGREGKALIDPAKRTLKYTTSA